MNRPPSKLRVLLALLGLSLAQLHLPAQTSSQVSRWEPEIKVYEASDRTNAPPQNGILFLGSSSLRLWKSLPQAFPGKPVFNRGFGGSQIADSTAFAERIIFPYHPRQIVFYAGDNDLAAGKSAEQVIADYRAFVRTVRARLPETKIAYISIKPSPARWKLEEKIQAVNHAVAAMKEEGLAFIDVHAAMLGAEGTPRKELFKPDGLHPNAKCYALWASMIGPCLK